MFLHRHIITVAAFPLLIGCTLGGSHLSRPFLVVPPPALTNCKAQTFIDHRVGEGETIQDVSELYLGKREAWNAIAACNPDADPIILSSGTELFVPVISPRVKVAVATKPTKSTKKVETAAKVEPVVDSGVTKVAIRGETTHATGDIPKAKSSIRIQRAAEPEPPAPSRRVVEENFQVLPDVTYSEPKMPKPKLDPKPMGTPISTIDRLKLQPEASQELEGASLSSISPKSGSSLLLCTGKNCLPGSN